jgi:predicted Rossmann fold nucleotide-binding protein DprA/Smf involved in DNA uptake
MPLTNDAHALILACSYVGLDQKTELAPLTLKEWNVLAPKILASALKTPGGMLGLTAETLKEELGLSLAEAQRLAALLDRGGAVGFELESLLNAGIQIVTRADSNYPPRLKEKLQAQAPVVLFYAGELALTQHEAVAIIGSRAVDEAGAEFAARLAAVCVRNHMNVVSGGAKGVDLISMKTAVENGGKCVGAMSDSLAKKIRERETRQYIFEERLLLLTPFHPNAPFQIGNAMARNKLIYALADYAIVVASDFETGGTWAGATENLRQGYTPLFVRSGDNAPKGNRALLSKNAAALTAEELAAAEINLRELLARKMLPARHLESSTSQQARLF